MHFIVRIEGERLLIKIFLLETDYEKFFCLCHNTYTETGGSLFVYTNKGCSLLTVEGSKKHVIQFLSGKKSPVFYSINLNHNPYELYNILNQSFLKSKKISVYISF